MVLFASATRCTTCHDEQGTHGVVVCHQEVRSSHCSSCVCVASHESMPVCQNGEHVGAMKHAWSCACCGTHNACICSHVVRLPNNKTPHSSPKLPQPWWVRVCSLGCCVCAGQTRSLSRTNVVCTSASVVPEAATIAISSAMRDFGLADTQPDLVAQLARCVCFVHVHSAKLIFTLFQHLTLLLAGLLAGLEVLLRFVPDVFIHTTGGVHAACVQARVRLQAHAGVCAPSHDHTHKMASDVAAGNATSVCNRKALSPACQSMQTAQLHACSRSFITLLVEQHGWQWQTARGLLAISAACGQKHAFRWCLRLARFPKAVVPTMKASWHKRTATGCWWCQLASSDTKSSTRCS